MAEVDEYAVEVLDGEMASLGGTITRRPAAEVVAEMEAAEASAKEARRVMREATKAEFAQTREQSKEEWDKRVSALKQKLSGHDEA